ncbi:MAG: hypothetical protein LLF94_12085, partial [Chlamydiales bacterium]|nr:hypothetical protein [Chlamydiales bacterium]
FNFIKTVTKSRKMNLVTEMALRHKNFFCTLKEDGTIWAGHRLDKAAAYPIGIKMCLGEHKQQKLSIKILIH